VDGDGVIEIVWGGDDGRVWAWHADGTALAGFPRAVGPPGRNVLVALADLDGRPGLEIVAAHAAGSIHAFRADGSSLPGWPVSVSGPLSAPVVATLGSDPRPCVVALGNRALYAFDRDGSPRWPAPAPAPLGVGSSPAAGDLDGDGRDDIAVMTLDTLAVFDSAGARRFAIRVSPGTVWRDPPVVIGPLGGGRTAVMTFAGTRPRAWDARGAQVTGFYRPGGAGISPSLADLDGDGRTEVIAGSGADSLLHVFDAGPGSWRDEPRSWPTSRGNAARTGSRLGERGAITPPLLPLVGAVVERYRVRLSWSAAGWPGLDAVVYRREGGGEWTALGSVSPGESGLIEFDDERVMPDRTYGYRLGVPVSGREVLLEATRVEVPTILSLVSAVAEPDRIRLSWSTVDGTVSSGTLYRWTEADGWKNLLRTAPDGSGLISYEDTRVTPGLRYGYRVGVLVNGGEALLGETFVHVPRMPAYVSTDARSDRARILWHAADPVVSATVYRRTASDGWRSLGPVAPDARGMLQCEDPRVLAGERYAYRLGVVMVEQGRELFTDEIWVGIPGQPAFALSGPLPHPATPDLAVAFALPDGSPARFEVLDLTGRRILEREVGSLGAGYHVARLGEGRSLAPGVYLVRLIRAGRALTVRAVVTR
jgi:FG-GAP repeat protein